MEFHLPQVAEAAALQEKDVIPEADPSAEPKIEKKNTEKLSEEPEAEHSAESSSFHIPRSATKENIREHDEYVPFQPPSEEEDAIGDYNIPDEIEDMMSASRKSREDGQLSLFELYPGS